MESLVWKTLFSYHWPRMRHLACEPHRQGVAALGYSETRPADPEQLTRVVRDKTGWELVRAYGEVSSERFFGLLSQRQFPMVYELRPLEQLFAASDPDRWHEAFGHLPLLFDRRIRRLYEWFGKAAVAASLHSEVLFKQVAQLYWFVGEVGLVREGWSTKILGAGLLASPLSPFKLRHRTARIEPFSIQRVLNSAYNPYQFQGLLFRIPSIEKAQARLSRWLATAHGIEIH